MTVVLDWAKADWTVPAPPQTCTFCGSNLRPPFMHWDCTPDDDGRDTILVCARCCHWCRHGFAADMARVDAIEAALEAGPECPTLRGVQ
jgi:hypothetical protein